MENTECTIVKSARPGYWYKSGCVTLTRCIITLCFTSSSLNVWLIFQAKNNGRSAPACTALTEVSHWSHNARGKGERNGVQRRTKVSFGKTMMQTLELLRLAKRQRRSDGSPDEATLNSKEIKAVAMAVIELRLSEGISKGVGQSVSQSVNQSISRKFD